MTRAGAACEGCGGRTRGDVGQHGAHGRLGRAEGNQVVLRHRGRRRRQHQRAHHRRHAGVRRQSHPTDLRRDERRQRRLDYRTSTAQRVGQGSTVSTRPKPLTRGDPITPLARVVVSAGYFCCLYHDSALYLAPFPPRIITASANLWRASLKKKFKPYCGEVIWTVIESARPIAHWNSSFRVSLAVNSETTPQHFLKFHFCI